MDTSDPATCPATHTGPTASGTYTVTCHKPAGHIEAGDRQHEGRHHGMPARWVGEVTQPADHPPGA